ncbi:MAG TPA: beta-ketoacyl synthase N-terminal-like domain-containing protein, partial [Micromonosporaceae bacterium]|nr:beta-ketoacyl synthase N-terminal-like domain-containing protein [Micromonosporaceae bacterium]
MQREDLEHEPTHSNEQPALHRPSDVAVIGVGCRFPGGVTDLDALWRVFLDGADVTGPVPPDRPGAALLDVAGTGSFLTDIDRFDTDFFGVSPREANEMDPQQRLLLEAAWSAMEHAGVPRERWAGSRTGVYLGILSMDYAVLHSRTLGVDGVDAYYASGKEFSFGAGRIAYTFGLHGPCMMLTAACASSLLAVHLAARAIAAGDCDTALAGGVNLLVGPELSVYMRKIQALSPHGRCRPFDAAADGVIRGEGCGVVALKRYADAVADGDRIWAVIRGSAANHDGRSAGLTAPNAVAQDQLLRAAMRDAGVAPTDIDYVEAHSTGTPLGDPIELSALSLAIGQFRPPDRPLLIGSHKANFGHLDSSAGILGLLKAILVVRNGVAPPQIKLDRPTPTFSWAGSGLAVPTVATPLAGRSGPFLAGVSAFGLSGTNVHVLVGAPAQPVTGSGEPVVEGPATATVGRAAEVAQLLAGDEPLTAGGPVVVEPVLVVSGPTPAALRAQVDAYRAVVAGAGPDDLADVVHSAAARRTHHPHRLAVVGASAAALDRALGGYLAGRASPGYAVDGLAEAEGTPVVHVFSGQGAQWPAMGLDLYAASRVVRDTLDECDALVRDTAGWSLLDRLRDPSRDALAQTEHAQPAVFTLQLALSRLWSSWGVGPGAVIGHSLGEAAAACVAGALSLADAVRLVVHRGRLMQQARGSGSMVAVELPASEVAEVLARCGGEVRVATVNGPASVIIAGPADPLHRAVAALQAGGATCLPLGLDCAFHTPAMRPYGDALADLLGGLAVAQPTVPFLSTVDPEVDQPVPDAAYWGRNACEPVLFWPAVDRFLARRAAVFVEVGPHPVMARSLGAALAYRDRGGTVAGTLSRDRPTRSTVAYALAKLYAAGVELDWRAVYPGRRRYVPLPAVPLAGERYWLPVTGGTVPGGRRANGTASNGGGRSAEATGNGGPNSGSTHDGAWPAGSPAGAAPAGAGGPGAGALRAEVRLFDAEGRLVTTLSGLHAGAPAADPVPVGAAPVAAAGPAAAAGPVAVAGPVVGAKPVADAAQAAGAGPAVAAAAAPEEPAPAATEPAAAAAAPRQPGRERVAALVTSLAALALGYAEDRRLSRTRGFFDLGMDSLTLVEFVRQVEREVGWPLGASAAIEHPTIDALTDYIVAAAPPAAPEVRPPAPGPAEDPATTAPAAEPAPSPAPGDGPAAGTAPAGVVESPAPRVHAAAVLPRPGAEPIAIVGMGCRVPGAEGLDAYWRLLRDGVDATAEVPADRWDAQALLADGSVRPGTVVTGRGGFLDRVDLFDSGFFRVSAREARSMDPQQRIFAEVAWEALEDAGVDTQALRAGRTGLFVGMNTTDYQQLLTRRAVDVDLYYGTGNSFSGAPGRLSYFLGIRGPSMAVDTACSSSLVAVHLACQSLRAGEAELALAGGVNVMVTPTVYLAMSAAGALAPDGRCKPFDASADGYGRGEGAGVVVLKTLARAVADGDRVYAVIRGSAVNHNGASGGLTVPSTDAQRELIKAALDASALSPAEVDYVEAHGTGTRLGDAAELGALAGTLGPGRPAERPLLVGSVKTNIGHLEAAAGVAGLIKTALALWHGEIPPHLHFSRPTDQVDWDRIPVRVAAARTPWRAAGSRPRAAGVSAFGFTGTNAHVVVTEAEAAPSPRGAGRPPRAHLLVVSAATETALVAARERLRERVAALDPQELADACFTAGARRTHLEHRLALVGSSQAELLNALAPEPSAFRRTGTARPGEARQVVLVYGTGANVPWESFDRDEPAFREKLDALDAAAGPGRRSIRQALRAGGLGGGDPVAVTAVQIALTGLWREHGITPGALLGFGPGEVAAAHAAGLLDLEQVIEVARRGRPIQLSGEPAVPLWLASLGGPVPRGAQPPWGSYESVNGSAGAAAARLAAGLLADGLDLLVAVDTGGAAGHVAAGEPGSFTVIGADLHRGVARGRDCLVRAVAELYVHGCPIDWSRLFGRRPYRVGLPSYPWQRRRHWFGGADQPRPAAEATEAQVTAGPGVPAGPGAAPAAVADAGQAAAGNGHAVAGSDHAVAGNGHGVAGSDHAVAGNGHGAAGDGPGAGPGVVLTPLAGQLLGGSAQARGDRLLDFVLSCVAEVLGEDSAADVEPDNGFFDLGMDSVMALTLKGRLEGALGLEL